MSEFLIGTAIIVFLFLLAVSREMHRGRLIRLWIEHHPEAKLHRPFVPSDHPEFPVADLLEKALGRQPLSYASAVEIRRPEGVRWLAEYRTTPPGAKTDHWFTLSAGNAGGTWSSESLRGLITVKKLDAVPSGENPAVA